MLVDMLRENKGVISTCVGVSIALSTGMIALAKHTLEFYPTKAEVQTIADDSAKSEVCIIKEKVNMTYNEVVSIRQYLLERK